MGGGALWKEISAAARAPYDKKAADEKEAYEKFIATDEGKKALVEKKSAQADVKADKNKRLCKAAVKAVEKDAALKKPVSSYWLWLSDNREKIVKALGGKGSVTDVSKKGGEMWKALSEKDKLPYDKKAKEQKEAYEKYIASDEGKEKLKAFKDATQAAKDQFKAKDTSKPTLKKGADEVDEGDKNGAKKNASPKKRTSASGGVTPPAAKRGRTASGSSALKKPAADASPGISADLLKQAEGLGLAVQLKNLAARADVAGSSKSHEQMLAALKSNGGLVNKAKAALLGA